MKLIDADELIKEIAKIPGLQLNTRTIGEAIGRVPEVNLNQFFQEVNPDQLFVVKTNRFLSPKEFLSLELYLKSQRENIMLLPEDCSIVYPERKKGVWINRSLHILYPIWERYTCSVCGKHSYNYDFCPNCGADMRGDKNEIN